MRQSIRTGLGRDEGDVIEMFVWFSVKGLITGEFNVSSHWGH